MKKQKVNTRKQETKISRRMFVGRAAAIASLTIVPRYVLGCPA